MVYRRTKIAVLLVVATLALALAAPAFAGGKARVWIDEHNPYELGEEVTFAYENNRTNTPWVRLRCYQEDELVLAHSLGMWDGAVGDGIFTLGPTVAWSEGDADCVAELGHRRGGRFKTEAKFGFHVYG